MTPAEFIAKWRQVELRERQAAQSHFADLCALVGHATPTDADPLGEFFCYEKGAEKHGGGDGWADVWKRGSFGWEYKGKHKDLDAAYDQLLLYREALESRSWWSATSTASSSTPTSPAPARRCTRSRSTSSPSHAAVLEARAEVAWLDLVG